MRTCNEYLDACKSALGLDSDYALAHALGITRQSVSNIRNNRRTFDNLTAFRVADVLKIDPAAVIATAQYERTGNKNERAVWLGIVEKFGGLAACFALGVGLVSAPTPARANTDGFIQSAFNNNTNYAK